jgi:hypothetical protein
MYVALDGSDYSGDGSIAKPYQTLGAALYVWSQRRNLSSDGMIIRILYGDYINTGDIYVSTNQSGTDEKPLIIDGGGPDQKATFLGGRKLSSFPLHTGASRISEVPVAAQSAIVAINLSSVNLGNSIMGETCSGCSGLSSQLYFNNAPLTLARYPNVTEAKPWIKITSRNSDTTFSTDDTSLKTISTDPSVYATGFWIKQWSQSDSYISINSANGRVTLTTSSETPIATSLFNQARFFFQNLLPGLDEPGEYYFDRTTKILYIYPPDGATLNDITISESNRLLTVSSTSNVIIKNLNFKYARDRILNVWDSEKVILSNLSLLGSTSYCLSATDSTKVTIYGNNISDCGDGVFVTQGTVSNSDNSQLEIFNSNLSKLGLIRRTFFPALVLGGNGVKSMYNSISNTNAAGIQISGSSINTKVLRNNISHASQEINDVGAIYRTGQNPNGRGDLIKNNVINSSLGFLWDESDDGESVGIYLDDRTNEHTVSHNCIDGVSTGILVGGGQYNQVIDNKIAFASHYGIHVDERGGDMNSWYFNALGNPWQRELNSFQSLSPEDPLFTLFPNLVGWDLDPFRAKNNIITGNEIGSPNGLRFLNGLGGPTRQYFTVENNNTQATRISTGCTEEALQGGATETGSIFTSSSSFQAIVGVQFSTKLLQQPSFLLDTGLSVEITGLPEGANFDSTTSELTWLPNGVQSSTINMKLKSSFSQVIEQKNIKLQASMQSVPQAVSNGTCENLNIAWDAVTKNTDNSSVNGPVSYIVNFQNALGTTTTIQTQSNSYPLPRHLFLGGTTKTISVKTKDNNSIESSSSSIDCTITGSSNIPADVSDQDGTLTISHSLLNKNGNRLAFFAGAVRIKNHLNIVQISRQFSSTDLPLQLPYNSLPKGNTFTVEIFINNELQNVFTINTDPIIINTKQGAKEADSFILSNRLSLLTARGIAVTVVGKPLRLLTDSEQAPTVLTEKPKTKSNPSKIERFSIATRKVKNTIFIDGCMLKNKIVVARTRRSAKGIEIFLGNKKLGMLLVSKNPSFFCYTPKGQTTSLIASLVGKKVSIFGVTKSLSKSTIPLLPNIKITHAVPFGNEVAVVGIDSDNQSSLYTLVNKEWKKQVTLLTQPIEVSPILLTSRQAALAIRYDSHTVYTYASTDGYIESTAFYLSDGIKNYNLFPSIPYRIKR